jgi:hypothetical protein
MKPTIAHVNQAVLAFNRKNGTAIPHITVKLQGKTTRYCSRLEWSGSGRLRDSAAEGIQPLHCGARTWMEFDGEVTLVGEMTYPQIQQAMADAGGDASVVRPPDSLVCVAA